MPDAGPPERGARLLDVMTRGVMDNQGENCRG